MYFKVLNLGWTQKRSIQNYVLFVCFYLKQENWFMKKRILKVEKILKGSLDSIPSPSPSVKIMGGKNYLR